MARCTKATKMRRVDIVYRLMLHGLNGPQIVQHIQTKYAEWGVKERAIYTYMQAANELIYKAGEFERPYEFGMAAAQLRDLYSRALREGDLRTARLVRKDLTELYGLDAPKRIEVTEILALLDSEISEREQELADLERQYALPAANSAGD